MLYWSPLTWWWILFPPAIAIIYYIILTRALDMFAYSRKKDKDGDDGGWVPYVATPMVAVHKMLEMCEVKPGDVVYDLGCGDGRFLRVASDVYGARAVGFEAAESVYWLAKMKMKFWYRPQNVEILCQDFWNADLSEADVVILFLFPRILSRLQYKLRTELKPGARVVTFNWNIKGWKESKHEHVAASFRSKYQGKVLTPIYVYEAPFRYNR